MKLRIKACCASRGLLLLIAAMQLVGCETADKEPLDNPPAIDAEMRTIAVAYLTQTFGYVDILENELNAATPNEENLRTATQNVLLAVEFAGEADLDVASIYIGLVELLCVLGLPELRELYVAYDDLGSLAGASSFLERSSPVIERRINEGQQVLGGRGCYTSVRRDAAFYPQGG